MTVVLGEGTKLRFGRCSACFREEAIKDYRLYSPLAPEFGGVDKEVPLCINCRGCII